MEPQQVRVALLTNIVPPYRVPVYRALADTPGWRLRVFTNAETEFDRSWQVDTSGLDVECVPSLSLVRGHRTLHLPWALPPALARWPAYGIGSIAAFWTLDRLAGF